MVLLLHVNIIDSIHNFLFSITTSNFLLIFVGSILGAVLTFLITKQINRSEARKDYEKERFDNLFNAFITLRDDIHRGAVFDFYDLSSFHQEDIMNLLIKKY